MRSTSAAGGSIAPTVQFENLAIHTVLRRLSNFHLGQYLSPSALVDLMFGCLESKQRSQLRGGVDRKAFLFAVTSLSCGSPTLSHPPLRTPPGPRRYSGQRSGERDGRAVEPNRGLPEGELPRRGKRGHPGVRRFAARNDSLICSINCNLTERYVTE